METKKRSITIAVVVIALCAVVACSENARNTLTGPSAIPGALAASPNADTHTLHGTAEVTQMPGVTYANTIEAKLNAAGEASGTLTVRILDLSGFGVPDARATVMVRIDCLEFAGDSVWFGGEVTSASDKSLLDPSITATIGQVRVTDGQSYLFSGPAPFYVPPGTTCTDRPSLPIQPVNSGGFHIK
jgi:hypothetical protein